MTKLKQDRTRKSGYLGSLNIQDPHPDRPPQAPWTGAHDQTRAFYRRVVATALADMAYKKSDYARHFDPALMSKAIKAMDALAKHLEATP